MEQNREPKKGYHNPAVVFPAVAWEERPETCKSNQHSWWIDYGEEYSATCVVCGAYVPFMSRDGEQHDQ